MAWISYIALVVGLFFVVAGVQVFKEAYKLTGNLIISIVITIVYEILVVIGGFLSKTWKILEGKWAEKFADWVELTLQSIFSGYRHRYLEFLVFQNRAFDVKGLSVQGPYNLELNRVYVQLGVDPTPLPGISTNPIQKLPEKLLSGSHTIWQYIGDKNIQGRNFAILGAPGSGKTTLLKHMALTLAAPRHRRNKVNAPNLLPILLFLRDHAQAINANPSIPLSQLIRDQFESRQAPLPPKGWLEKQIEGGHCLIMLDGLDEVADIGIRKQVVSWVEKCMAAYGRNWFVISSRPHGYKTNPLENVTVLQVRPFNGQQIELFVHNWYLANEIMSAQKDDPGVREDARAGAVDLLDRVRSTYTLSDLAVNPLLLTMIATVHRYRSSLPGRRVELYAQICEVFLGTRQMARGLQLDLTPAQKIRVLRQLAYTMMEKELRVIDRDDAIRIITKPLSSVSPKIKGGDFLIDVENSSGLLVEFESGSYSFSHLTFQEYLASVHVIEARLENELNKKITNSWWQEAIRLYCAQTDASQMIIACLNSSNINALSLAIECMDEAREVSPETRTRYQEVIDKGVEDPDPERRKLVASALLKRRTR